MLNLVHFVGRSGDYTRSACGYRWRSWPSTLPDGSGTMSRERLSNREARPVRRWTVRAALCVVIAGVVGAVAFVGPWKMLLQPIEDYPSLARGLVFGRQPDGLCVFLEPRDLCGLPAQQEATVQHVRLIFDRLEGVKARGETFAVVDETGSLFYLGAGAPSFSRYPGSS